MRAWSTDKRGTIADVKLTDRPEPAAGAGQVRVKVRAAAVNPSDLKILGGLEGASFIHGMRPPYVLGNDYAGDVDQVGAGVRDIAVGAPVFGFLPFSPTNRQGTFSEHVVVGAGEVGHMGRGVTYVEAASAATSAVTALQALRKGRIAAGKRVLVNGASGGVGSVAVQIARHLGAQVWGTCGPSNVEHVRRLGVVGVYNHRETPISAIPERFDLVLDAASTSSYAECSAQLDERGAYVTLLPGPSLVTGLLASLFSSRSVGFIGVKAVRGDLDQVAAWMAEGALRVSLEAVFPFEDVPAALTRLAAGQVAGKVAVAFDDAARLAPA